MTITEDRVNAAQQAWCDGLVEIGKVHQASEGERTQPTSPGCSLAKRASNGRQDPRAWSRWSLSGSWDGSFGGG
jgi:hypothetical protein